MSDSGTSAPSLCFPIALNAAGAAQPHSAQTGRPPNRQGVTRVVRSAEMQVVVWAKMHSCGEDGGCR
jgi:hypothetical protein